MAGVFISYRRSDTAGHAGRMFDRLAAHFGVKHVFMDVDGMGSTFGVTGNDVRYWVGFDLDAERAAGIERLVFTLDGEICVVQGPALTNVLQSSTTEHSMVIHRKPVPPTSVYPPSYGDLVVRGRLAARDARHRTREMLPKSVRVRYETRDGTSGKVTLPAPKKWLTAYQAIRWH